MIVLDINKIVIEDLEKILVLESDRIRCLLKHAVFEMKGSQFRVHSLSQDELIVYGRCKSVELNEK